MNGRYPSTWWNALGTGFLVVLAAAVLAYAPWLLFVALLVMVITVATAFVVLAAIFTKPRQVSDTPNKQEEKT